MAVSWERGTPVRGGGGGQGKPNSVCSLLYRVFEWFGRFGGVHELVREEENERTKAVVNLGQGRP